jgi:hypothetical protein
MFEQCWSPSLALKMTPQEQKQKAVDGKLIQPFELGGGLEFAVEVAVDDLHEEFAEVGEAGRGQRLVGEVIDGIAEHAQGEVSGFERHLGAGYASVTLADQTVAQGVEKRRLADERFATFDALVERGKEAHEADGPEVEVGYGHPDGTGFEALEDSPGEAEDPVVGFAVGHEFIKHFGDVGESYAAGVVHWGGEWG